MLYAKFSSTYPSSNDPKNTVVRYDVSGTPAEIAEYLGKNPKAIDSATGGAIFNLTIRPDSVRKDYPAEGPLKVSAKGNHYVDGSNVVNALNLVKQMGGDPMELIMALTGLQGSSFRASISKDIEAKEGATPDGLDNV